MGAYAPAPALTPAPPPTPHLRLPGPGGEQLSSGAGGDAMAEGLNKVQEKSSDVEMTGASHAIVSARRSEASTPVSTTYWSSTLSLSESAG